MTRFRHPMQGDPPAQIYMHCTHFNIYLLTDLGDNSAIHLTVFWDLPFFVLTYFQVSLSR